MKVQEILDKTTQYFKEKGFITPRLDSELILSEALNLSRIELYLHHDRPFSHQELDRCRDLVRRRGLGEPVAYITGKKGFYKNDFFVKPGVLIPRPETESLVDETLNWSRQVNKEAINIIDLGSGSGCVGLSIVSEIPDSRLISVDVSMEAVETTRKNAENLGLESRVRVLNKDVDHLCAEDLDFLEKKVDVVVSNPPYIADESKDLEPFVKQYEPSLALFAGKDGLSCLKNWSQKAKEILNPGGFVCFEIGFDQKESVERIFLELGGFKEFKVGRDLAGRDRWISALKEE
ncbi:MAG: peptide chain release factor N(5)-glutamine methyltransferase [Bdellovibrionales bacterium]|nr:peptide chain release factor N(5)-glutamine methyltransferase [Bdellovibrionales bacterium]